MDRQREQLDSFEMVLKKPNNKNLFYNMKLLKDNADYGDYYIADYSYGSCGARGKSYFKHFHKSDAERKGITAVEEATNFFEDKKAELIAKGYVNKQEVDNSVKLHPGEHVYLEWRDVYSGERSFFDIELSACGRFIFQQQGDFHGKSVKDEYHAEDLKHDYINERLKDFKERGYKQKTRPKSLPTMVVHPWGREFEESNNSDDDENASEEEEEAVVAPKATKPTATKVSTTASKGKGKGKAAAKKRKTKKDVDDEDDDDDSDANMDGSGSEMGLDEFNATVKQTMLALQKKLKQSDGIGEVNKKEAVVKAKEAYPDPSSPIVMSAHCDEKVINRPHKKPKLSENELIAQQLREYALNYKS